MKLPGIEGLLFDLDGTLVLSEHFHCQTTIQVLAARGIVLTPDQNAIYEGWSEEAIWQSLADRFGLGEDWRELAEERAQAYVDLVTRSGLRPLPGALVLLSWARTRGLPMAVASSLARAQIDAALAASGLADFLPVRRSGQDDVPPGRGKPAPDVYLLAAEALGLDPRTCIAFEDSPTGLASARAAGCFVVAIPGPSFGSDTPQADLVCASLADALAVLRETMP